MAVIYLYDANGNILWLTEAIHFDFEHYSRMAKEICVEEGDGLLVFNPETHAVRIINQDGTDGEFCGNGLQAAAFHAGQSSMDLMMGGRLIQTMSEGHRVKILLDANPGLPQRVEWRGVIAYALNMPNPHCVFINPPSEWQLEKEGAACCIEWHTNVEWVRREADFFEVSVYERGAGITAACGSGALAVFTVLHALDQVRDRGKIKMQGGILTVEAIGSKLSLQGHVRLLKSKVI
ncbi:MAG: hypothetical protein NTV32_05770 [Gammaproteobacteria bacterium]|nr:hypothetical protein [Gammaproteobacteria bacterium]